MTLDMWFRATTLVFGPIIDRPASRSMLPSSRTGMKRSTTPLRSRRKCQGMMLAWCSSSDTTISSPACSCRPTEAATRLIASVAPLVNTTWREEGALMKRATLSRAAS